MTSQNEHQGSPASPVCLDDDLSARIAEQAQAEGLEPDVVVRHAVEAHLARNVSPETAPPLPEEQDICIVPWQVIEAVLYSDEEALDGIFFEEINGVTVMYYGGHWLLHEFLACLAHAMGPVIRPDLEGFNQIRATLIALTLDILPPVPDPQEGQACWLPNIRIEGMPSITSST